MQVDNAIAAAYIQPVIRIVYNLHFDAIGNRITAGEGDATRSANYSANQLNQYTQRQVPAETDIIGTASTNTTISVNDQSVTRHSAYWHDIFPVVNASAAAYSQAVIRAVYNPPSTNDPDTVAAATGRVFVAQTPEVFSYDQDGNLLADGRFSYAWDAENRLTNVTTRTDLPAAVPRVKLVHAYDYMSRRFQTVISFWTNGAWQVSSTNLFAYDQWNIVQETHATLLTGNCALSTNLYIWGIDLSGTLHGAGGIGGLLQSLRLAGGTPATPLVFCYDANGNVTELIDASAALAAHYEYGPFGQTVVQTGPAAATNPFRFSTKYLDRDTGLYYYGFRFYSPALGRWPNKDPIEENGGLNLYGFVANSPLGNVDYCGESWVPGWVHHGVEHIFISLGIEVILDNMEMCHSRPCMHASECLECADVHATSALMVALGGAMLGNAFCLTTGPYCFGCAVLVDGFYHEETVKINAAASAARAKCLHLPL